MARLFGTDGVRGIAGRDLTARLALDLAAAAGGLLADSAEFAEPGGHAERRPVAVVGRDPRASGEFLEAAVVAGLASAGVDVLRLGVLPTPAVAYLTVSLGADLGVVLSASHNPAPDNGIKFFSRGGFKLPDAAEDAIEERVRKAAGAGNTGGGAGGGSMLGRWLDAVPPRGFGRVTDATGERERYLGHLISTLRRPADSAPAGQAGLGDAGRPAPAVPGAVRPLAGLRVVVDCAHGAAYEIAPRALRRAGAEVITIGTEPDGLNINDGCGSTHLEALADAVVEHGADAGIAHDGDADRCLAVSADGQVVDGDQILAILALDLKEAERLTRETVVATVMSNLGFRRAMSGAGITVVDTAVGDRYVLEAMRAGGYVLGGEQSGHVILFDHATTGDGVLTALHLLAVAARRGTPLGDLAKVMTRFPQVLVNVKDVDKSRAGSSPEVAAAVAEAEAELADTGRVLIRPSGTEPAVRVMVEAAGQEQARRVAGRLADVVRAALAR